MAAELIKRLVSDPDQKKPLSFIWAAPLKLHTQSKDTLEIMISDFGAAK